MLPTTATSVFENIEAIHFAQMRNTKASKERQPNKAFTNRIKRKLVPLMKYVWTFRLLGKKSWVVKYVCFSI